MPYDDAYVARYFNENQDNPYGVWNYLQQLLLNESPPEELTQLPPLNLPKSEEKQRQHIERMREQASPGDMVFTYDRTSGLARLIRKHDWGMWSHVANVDADKSLSQITLGGHEVSSFYNLASASLDVGLYRIPELSDDDRKKMLEFLDTMAPAITGYNWRGVIRVFLNKRFGIPYRRRSTEVTPNEMIYQNYLRLICYA
jgi:hypothetical protein